MLVLISKNRTKIRPKDRHVNYFIITYKKLFYIIYELLFIKFSNCLYLTYTQKEHMTIFSNKK